MDEIALHIEFLLHTHDCVIVPGLGGFVVNVSEVERNGLWGIDAPRCELIFNSKLTYNDGLLAESLMKTNTISFDSAISKIDSASEELKNKLTKGEQVEWCNLGLFKGINENKRPVFIPNKYFIRPHVYGLVNARLKPATLISSRSSDKNNSIPLKPFIQYISSGIAMALLLFFIVVSYNDFDSKNQQAEIVSKSLIFNNSNSKAIRNKATTAKLTDTSKTETNATKLPLNNSTTSDDTSLIQEKAHSNYYVIIGVYEVREVAEKTLNRLKNEGFMNASILERSGRLDVYSSSFTDKSEAQDFLKKFQLENPKYHDAWLLKR